MAKPENTETFSAFQEVTAFTDNLNDNGFSYSFEQKNTSKLTFKVKTDPSVKTIYFVLWSLYNPAKPEAIERLPNVAVSDDGEATIEIGPDHPRLHLGPGPYCASLTASGPTMGGLKIVDNFI